MTNIVSLEKDVDLNINKFSRKRQQIEKQKKAGQTIIAFGSFLILVSIALIFLMEFIFFPVIGLIIGVWLFFAALSTIKKANISLEEFQNFIEETEARYKKKINHSMKPVDFKTAESDISDLVVSKEILDASKKQKIILDHRNQVLYYITIDNTEMNESVKYREILYSDIIQAVVVIDNRLISKTSIGSKVGGAVIGGLVAGGTGAIIGGTNTKRTASEEINKIELRIIVSNPSAPLITIQLNNRRLKKESEINSMTSLADDWKSTLDVIINEERKKPKQEVIQRKTPKFITKVKSKEDTAVQKELPQRKTPEVALEKKNTHDISVQREKMIKSI